MLTHSTRTKFTEIADVFFCKSGLNYFSNLAEAYDCKKSDMLIRVMLRLVNHDILHTLKEELRRGLPTSA